MSGVKQESAQPNVVFVQIPNKIKAGAMTLILKLKESGFYLSFSTGILVSSMASISCSNLLNAMLRECLFDQAVSIYSGA